MVLTLNSLKKEKSSCLLSCFTHSLFLNQAVNSWENQVSCKALNSTSIFFFPHLHQHESHFSLTVCFS